MTINDMKNRKNTFEDKKVKTKRKEIIYVEQEQLDKLNEYLLNKKNDRDTYQWNNEVEQKAWFKEHNIDFEDYPGCVPFYCYVDDIDIYVSSGSFIYPIVFGQRVSGLMSFADRVYVPEDVQKRLDKVYDEWRQF